MNMDDYISYLEKNQHKKNRRLFIYFILFPLIFLLINNILLYVVRNASIFNIPNDAATYLLETLFHKFSYLELKSLLILANKSNYFPFLLFIYIIYHILYAYIIFISILFFLLRITYINKYLNSYKHLLLKLSYLSNNIEQYIISNNKIRKLLLILKIKLIKPCYRISPLSYHWYKKPMFQWFESASMPREICSIVHVLDRYDDALIKAIQHNWCLNDFKKSINYLKMFLFSIALRSDDYLKRHPDKPVIDYSEKDTLYMFSRSVKSLIIGVGKNKGVKKYRVLIFIEKILSQQVFRNGLTIAALRDLLCL